MFVDGRDPLADIPNNASLTRQAQANGHETDRDGYALRSDQTHTEVWAFDTNKGAPAYLSRMDPRPDEPKLQRKRFDPPNRARKAAMTKAPSTIALGSHGISRYLEETKKIPLLETAEEYLLAKRWHETADSSAADKLVTSHLRLVVRIARAYCGYGLPIGELISEGNVGLLRAVKRFNPDKGCRLATYAVCWIRASIQEYVLRSWRRAKSQLQASEDGDIKPENLEAIAKKIGVKEGEVLSMNRRLGGDISLNVPLRDEADSAEWQDQLVDDAPDQEERLVDAEELDARKNSLAMALSILNERERRIFEARHLAEDPETLEDLSVKFGVSRARIRQIEHRAFEKLQSTVIGMASPLRPIHQDC
jgi:RNA polymerase sigma-32 factor